MFFTAFQYANMAVFMIVLRSHLLILVRTLLAHSILWKESLDVFQIWYSGVIMWPLSFVWSYLIEYAHNDLIINVGSFAIYSAFYKKESLNLLHPFASSATLMFYFFIVRIKFVSHQLYQIHIIAAPYMIHSYMQSSMV